MEAIWEELQTKLKNRHNTTNTATNDLEQLHPIPQHIPKVVWERVGDAVRGCEKHDLWAVSGDRWITLRLDGCGFGKHISHLRASGAIPNGFSTEFANLMQQCCVALMEKFSARCGYTQSDEITLLIPPAPFTRGTQHPHMFGGRVMKLCTVASALATAVFNHGVIKLYMAKNLGFPSMDLLGLFDCRLGNFDTQNHALMLFLWRAYDCGVNGVSDAVHAQKSVHRDAHEICRADTTTKLKWLKGHNLLPLIPHQASGSFFVRTKRIGDGFNPKTNETTRCLRSTSEMVPGNVIDLFVREELFPADDVLTPVAEK